VAPSGGWVTWRVAPYMIADKCHLRGTLWWETTRSGWESGMDLLGPRTDRTIRWTADLEFGLGSTIRCLQRAFVKTRLDLARCRTAGAAAEPRPRRAAHARPAPAAGLGLRTPTGLL